MRYLVWPTTLPYAMTGVRLAASVALILTITGELVIGTPGLGKEIEIASAATRSPPMYALVVVTGLLGVVANLATRAPSGACSPGIPRSARRSRHERRRACCAGS